MSLDTTKRSTIGYAMNKDPLDQPAKWNHFYSARWITATCGSGTVACVEICEDPDGTHYAWWDNDSQRFHYLWWDKMFVEMCFPYGTKAEEERGRGQLCRVSVIERGEQ